MTEARSILYLDGRDLERDCEAFMRFRLTYDGSLYSTQPPIRPNDPEKLKKWEKRFNKRIECKHCLRREFHRQLKELWTTHKFLKEARKQPGPLSDVLPDRAKTVWAHDPGTCRSLPEILGPVFGHSDYKFVPLVWKENSVFCSLRILFLRRDNLGSPMEKGDLDNRIKTVIDALTMPSYTQGGPLKDGNPFGPQTGEDPFFVLLDDDRQVTHLEVETDTALELNDEHKEDNNYVRLVISVEIRPYIVSLFNLSFGRFMVGLPEERRCSL